MRILLVKLASFLGVYKYCVTIGTYFKNKKLKAILKKDGLETLRRVDAALSNEGIKVFLTFGTLLGAYRDKKFIPYDNDLDVGMLAEDRPNNLDEIMLNLGFTKISQQIIKETGRVIEECYAYQDCKIDLFYYFIEGNDLFCYIARRHETKEWRQANREDGFPTDLSFVPNSNFERQSFLGLSLYIPTKTPEWLTDIYGASYMTPIKNWSAENHKTRIIKGKERSYRIY